MGCTCKELKIDCDAEPYIPRGKEVDFLTIGTPKIGTLSWPTRKLRLLGKSFISDKPIKESLLTVIVLNASVLDALLNHPHLVPEIWKGKRVFFPGTVYCHPVGHRFLRYLSWNGTFWVSGLHHFFEFDSSEIGTDDFFVGLRADS